jgi:hypothetical protein
MPDTQVCEETPPKPLVLSEDDLELKERTWKVFGRRKSMQFAELAQALTRAALVRRLIGLCVLVVDEDDPTIVWKTKLPVELRDQVFHRGSEFVERPDKPDLREMITENVGRLTAREREILEACILSVDWASTSHVFRVKLTVARVQADCTSAEIGAVLRKIGLTPSGNKGCTWVLPIWIRSII